ncbi:effector-associated domain EAD1-containing protein [Corallococcus sp. AB038B]|uniref:GAP1-N1 domain-containing protein n=1 Tax=Corallococcus sp. AB038B TaxID=2316718 RepID=UPI0011C40A4A|nr:effector-associated domain EAD1-containing protein [Corallococcus sp. AB038B]
MKVEQAVYGEARGGHALRISSDNGQISSELTSRLDLPDTAPPGVNWSPFLSGFPHKDRYVLARTLSDPTATRGGMVLSHAVIAPLDELSSMADLRPILSLLTISPVAPAEIATHEVSASPNSPTIPIDFVATAEALTARGSGPVVRIGHHGFEDLVISLWFRFWPELRAGFAFRLSFGPQDLIEAPKPSLVCTPTTLAARWAGHRIISSSPKANSRATTLLSGVAESKPILEFARETGIGLNDFTSLSLLERAYDIGSTATPTFEECVATLRLVERLSPSRAKGMAGKARLLDRLICRLTSASVRDVLLLRNLGTEALPSADSLWTGIRDWAAKNLFIQADDELLLSAINDATSEGAAVPAWKEALLTGLAEAAQSKPEYFSTAFWRWIDANPATLAAFFKYISNTPDFEASLSNAAPRNLRRDIGDTAMALAVSKRWLRLHGTATSATFAPSEAVHRQLSVDTDSANLDGVRASLLRATPIETLSIALETDDPRVLRIAAEVVAAQPHLLRDVSLHTASAQQIWAGALRINADAWQGPANPPQAFIAILNNLVDGKAANTDLISSLASSPIADISNYSRRTEVWHRVDDVARSRLLEATVAGWLKRATSAFELDTPEQALEVALLTSNVFDRTLRALAQHNTGVAVRIISAIPSYDEIRFVRWLDELIASRHVLPEVDAEAIGRLVLGRHWTRAVERMIVCARSGRDDFKAALRVCHMMVGMFIRWSLGLSPVSLDEKWLLLEELATELYPKGPDDNELWERAGGRHSDLQSNGSGRTRWRDALVQLRRGKGPYLTRLIQEMTGDFQHNEKLNYLATDPDFRSNSH